MILVQTAMLDVDHIVFQNFLLVLVLSLALFLLFGGFARLYCKGKRFQKEDRSTTELTMFLSNNGFMGFPITMAFFGNIGLLYMVANNVAMSIFAFTYGVSAINRGTQDKNTAGFSERFFRFLKSLANPNIIAAIGGILLCYSGVKLPSAATGFLETVGTIAGPMAMVSVGTMLAGSFGLHSFKKRAVLEPVISKLFIVPAMATVILWFLPLEPMAKMVLILANLLPSAAIVPLLCEQYGKDKRLASEIVVVSTLISMVSIPFGMWVLGLIGF